MTSVDPCGRHGSARRARTEWAQDDQYVAALNVVCTRFADPAVRRELALMLGYGEPEVRERYENGLRARQSAQEASGVPGTPMAARESVSGPSGGQNGAST